MHATTKIKWGMPDSLRSPRSARHTEGLPCSYLARERAHADYGIRSKKTLRRKLQTCSAGHLRRSRQQKRKICGQRTPSAPSLSPPSRDVCFFSGSSPPRGSLAASLLVLSPHPLLRIGVWRGPLLVSNLESTLDITLAR